MIGTRPKPLLRLLLWFAFFGGIGVALWCSNFLVFHWWAALEPGVTWVHRSGWLASVALIAAVAWVGVTGRLLYVGWPRRAPDGANWRPMN